jgi:hypothetical protein
LGLILSSENSGIPQVDGGTSPEPVMRAARAARLRIIALPRSALFQEAIGVL